MKSDTASATGAANPKPQAALLSMPKLAAILDVSDQKAMDMARSGELEADGIRTKLVGARLKAVRADVEAFIGHPITV